VSRGQNASLPYIFISWCLINCGEGWNQLHLLSWEYRIHWKSRTGAHKPLDPLSKAGCPLLAREGLFAWVPHSAMLMLFVYHPLQLAQPFPVPAAWCRGEMYAILPREIEKRRKKDMIFISTAGDVLVQAQRTFLFRGAQTSLSDPKGTILGASVGITPLVSSSRTLLHNTSLLEDTGLVPLLHETDVHEWLLTLCPWSASELYRPRDRRLSANLVPSFADRRCRGSERRIPTAVFSVL
jgi:hypothetical protein